MKNTFTILIENFQLSEKQQQDYMTFIHLLKTESEKYNLTNIKEFDSIVNLHLSDTLEITATNLLENARIIADIGSGCGVPGIVLALFYPEKKFILIEVTKKKINFLKSVIETLRLTNCVISEDDFQTFLRKELFLPDTFLARASLSVNTITDLLYNKKSPYQKSHFIYWASKKWKESEQHNKILTQKNFLIKEVNYQIRQANEIRDLLYLSIKKNNVLFFN